MKNHNIPKVVFDKNKNFFTQQGHQSLQIKNNTTNGFRQILIYTYPKNNG